MRVVIADDSGIFRNGLRLLLEATDIDVCDDVADLKALYDAVEKHHPDACILDIRMPPTHTDEGIRAAERLRATTPAPGVLVLSTYADSTWAARLLGDGRGGVGYLLKDRVDDGEELVEALQRVATGGTAVDPEIVASLISRPRRDHPIEQLTQRERDVLALMAQGRSNVGIANALFLAPKTVESYVAAVFTKLGLAHDTRELNDNRRVLAVLAYLQRTPSG